MPAVPILAPSLSGAPRVTDQPAPQSAQNAREMGRAFAATLAKATHKVDPSHTPLGGEEAAGALSDAWTGVTGQAPTAKQLSLLVAQWSLETGGGRAMMNNNFGGIKGHSPAGLSTAYTTKEGSGASERTLVDSFRAYSTPKEGADDYVRTLQARFPKSFQAIRAGDAAGFAHTLKREGYYTGSEADYTRAIGQISDRALTKGFGAVGQPGGAHTRVALSTPDDATSGDAAVRALDAMRMVDEMSRAALMIASGPLTKGNS